MLERKQLPKSRNLEITFYEELVKTRPDFTEALTCLGNAYTKKGLFKKGLEIDLRLMQLKPDDPIVHYNLACSYSLLGEVDKSLESLKKAVLLGYDDFVYLVKDKDLEELRKDQRFNKFMEKVKKNLRYI
jgi:tetratricopeptide (TPR) repeat protein